MKRVKRIHVMLAAAIAMLGTAPVHAACSVDTVSVAFGGYDPLSGQFLDGVGSVQVQCSPASGYQIALSSGNGSFASRQLLGSVASLAYNLYTNASRSIVWGDGNGGTTAVGGSGSDDTHTVYGRIPGGQISAPAGSYSDLIVVTVEF